MSEKKKKRVDGCLTSPASPRLLDLSRTASRYSMKPCKITEKRRSATAPEYRYRDGENGDEP